MGKLCLLLIITALGVLTLFPPWVLVRTVYIYGDGFWSLAEKTKSSETWTEMRGTQEICRIGHHPLWAFTRSTSDPSLSLHAGDHSQGLETHRLEMAGPRSVTLDIRLLLTEYGLVLVAGLLWNCGVRAGIPDSQKDGPPSTAEVYS